MIYAKSKGFALFEVLITVFIVAFGVLSLAAMQYKTLSLTRDADFRSIVSLHAEGLAEAIKANPVRVIDVSSNMSWQFNHYKENSPISDPATAPSKNCKSAACTQNELAAYDLYVFHKRLKDSFPVDGSIISQVCKSNNTTILPKPDDLGCTETGPLIIKIAWISKAKKQEALAASSNKNNAIEYGYQLKVEP